MDGPEKIQNVNFPNIRPEIQCHINLLGKEKEHLGKLIGSNKSERPREYLQKFRQAFHLGCCNLLIFKRSGRH